jgi:hypothetical protein
MLHFRLQPFTIDNACSVFYEAIAEWKIREFYARQGKKVNDIRRNPATELAQLRQFDLMDVFGTKWECKTDKACWNTGNVFIEHQALSHSEADYYLIDAFGFSHVVPTERLRERIAGTSTVRGRDYLSSTGTLLTQEELTAISIDTI